MVCDSANDLFASYTRPSSLGPESTLFSHRRPLFYSVSNFDDAGLPLFLKADTAQKTAMAMQYKKNTWNQNADFFLPNADVN
mmetsp:Transcript_8273/g.13655  ORF Transcript_8273/g.13655 Transcript_8273/m.13655 type:complete len:82 (+) Transcript_8273:391-636(+)